MRVTSVVLGVKGLFQVVRKHVPHSIIALDSLASLPKNTRIAIDASLLAQRLHFASENFEDRHVIGFRRIISQMRRHDLIPIMVFDSFGKNARLPAKMREQANRRMKRNVLSMRALIERQRADRLRSLQSSLLDWRAMSSVERAQASQRLRQLYADQQDAVVPVRHAQTETEDRTFLQLIEEEVECKSSLSESLPAQLQRDLDELFTLLETKELNDVQEWDKVTDELLAQVSALDSNELAYQDSQDASAGEVWSEILKAESNPVEHVVHQIGRLRRQFEEEGARLEAERFRTSVMQTEPSSTHNFRETQKQRQMRSAEADVYRLLNEGAIVEPGHATRLARDGSQAAAEADSVAAMEDVKEAAEAEIDVSFEDFPPDDETKAVYINGNMVEATTTSVEEQPATEIEEAGNFTEDGDAATNLPETPGQEAATTLAEERAAAGNEEAQMLGDDEIQGPSPRIFLFAQLAAQNLSLERSYLKASNPLSIQTLQACASVCEAEGVPVLWTGDGDTVPGRAHEGEAMASVLVRDDYADVVMTEDSDVVMYGVPLLRMRSVGTSQMELVNSELVRRTLFPPEAALAKEEEAMLEKAASKMTRARLAAAEAQTSGDEESSTNDTSAAMSPDLLEETTDDLAGASSEDASTTMVTDGAEEAAAPEPSSTTTLAERAEHASVRQMLEFALLCGTDFSRRIPGIGPETALKLIRKFGSIEVMRAEAERLALDAKRKASVAARMGESKENTGDDSSKTKTPKPKAKAKEAGTAVSLFPSAIRTQGLRFADNLTWREYSKELTAARQVFEKPPTLYFQGSKVRHLKREPGEWMQKAILTAKGFDEDEDFDAARHLYDNVQGEDSAEQGVATRTRVAAARKRRTKREEERKAAAQVTSGFGASPFGDGKGRVATWTP